MTVEENKAVVCRLLEEVVNQRNLTVVDEVIEGNCLLHGGGGQEVSGTKIIKQMLTTFFNAFDNFRVTIEDVVGEGDKVVVRFVEMGKHQSEFEGIESTGKEVMWTEMAIFRLERTRIVEMWTVKDRLSLMQQLGVIPSQ